MSVSRALLFVTSLTLATAASAALELPSTVTAEATSAAGAVVHYSAAGSGGEDDENGRPSQHVTCAPASGSTFAIGSTTVTCTSGQESGTFTVQVVDTTGPVLSLPSPIHTQQTTVHYSASATDAVDGNVAVSCAPASGSTFPAGTTSVQCSTSDTRGNTSAGSFTVTVTEPPAPPPPPVLPNDITREATGPDGAVVTYSTSGSGEDDENGRPSTSANCSPASGAKFPLGETTVQCTGGSFKVKIVDTTAPALDLPRDFSVAGTDSGATVTYTAKAKDLVDGDVAVSCSPASGTTFAAGATNVQCTSSDSRGNAAAGSFVVTVLVQPPPPPVLNDITREATGPNGAVVNYTAAGTGDDENGRPTQSATCSPVSGSTFPLGETQVTCSNGGAFKVTIVDTTAPALLLPGNIVTQDPVVTYTASAQDLVDGSVLLTCTPSSGSTFPLGTTVVQCSASDTRGNAASGSFTVTVQDSTQPDTEAPTFVSISASPDVLKPPNGKLVTVTVTASVIDNLDDAPLVRVFAIAANESIGAGDWEITGPMTVDLRAERDAHGEGRVYTISVEAIDAAGNRSTANVSVVVPHDSGSTSAPGTAEPTKKRRAARG